MIVLGLDTSTPSTAVALRGADGRTTDARDDPPAGAHPGHATRLLEMAAELLEAAGLRWRDVDRIAVGVGPGTFTGLRVGIATARGLAQSLSRELVGVSSPLALAAAALAAQDAEARSARAVLSAIDARRGEVFAAAYTASDAGAGEPLELVAVRPLAPEQLASVIAEAGPASAERSWLAVGDGAVRYRAQLERAGVPVAEPASPLHLVSAASICELGARAHAPALERVVPDYRRRPDAELALRGAGAARSE
ncbi:MAG TPA: tRNA (adenosine(37)-N6)-threonylcarbamoyltransferase complex dimerization subunit type 1 TsaB [Solirubrobacteraceae bacterium]|nr:tRNA (adenosine(37)-N6)-threonylcarbamoyltransferase complex dimerization subunit type 1 TsaB [Solirubrobacteraceae bacterium]